jgi:protein TonB
MFDLVAGATDHIPRRPAVPVLISLSAQIGLMTTIVIVSAVVGTRSLPETPTMMAFVAPAPMATPPPPPPVRDPQPRPTERPAPLDVAAPALTESVQSPASFEPESVLGEEGLDEDVHGGVEGGVAGGVADGVVSAQAAPLPLIPAAPPAAPALPAPIRVGGRVPQPELLHRVEPEYPRAAVDARMQGVVILETVVDEDGRVLEARVLRSAGETLDRAALTAIRQWRYAPLELNGTRVRFLLTATLSFKLSD